MRQILQDLSTGQIQVAEVPRPGIQQGQLLVETSKSLISAGTERMLLEFGRSGLIGKAKQQPDKVRQVLQKIQTDGLMTTMEAVRAKLDQPIPLGYSNAGTVVEAAPGTPFSMGERVVSNGFHADYVCVPTNLCARIPETVSDDAAAFTVLGAIGLQGVRLAAPSIGENFCVIGLGLIGLLTVQILRAGGCHVLGVDLDPEKCRMAAEFGAEPVDISRGQDPVEAAAAMSGGRGMDGVLITAATRSSEPVHQAAQMCRKRGRVILVGVSGLELKRDDFYEKELSFQVSCSYGPGRYDPGFEEKGHDYPFGYVRWTETRNFEAVLALMADKKLLTEPLVSHRFDIENAPSAYDVIAGSGEPHLGILLDYSSRKKIASTSLPEERTITLIPQTAASKRTSGIPVIGMIGAGSFAGQVLLPAIAAGKARLKTIVSRGGTNSAVMGKKFGFETASSDPEHVFSDSEIDAVIIATRHDTHAELALSALRAGKHVFVEKPLCLNPSELEQIGSLYETSDPRPVLTVGFNRRFSPLVEKITELIATTKAPVSIVMTINAGIIPGAHWIHDPGIGGGRIVGEVCHFIDLLRFLAASRISDSRLVPMASLHRDTLTATLAFANGSIGTVHYFSNGSKRFPKERIEVFCDGRILVLDNFRMLKGYGWSGFSKMKLARQDKGHRRELEAFLNAVRHGDNPPIPFDELVEVMETVFRLNQNG